MKDAGEIYIKGNFLLTFILDKIDLYLYIFNFKQRLTQEAKRLELDSLLSGKSVFCTMRYYRKYRPGMSASLIDVYTNLNSVQRFANNIQIVCNL